ncbi:glycoside hydrolase family 3 protein [Paenibacillus lautus]|uniref:glycoside hydrolase family 3 protein n=1 Tax=Paenibacillus lautus TaxID=1401 RepID=UPI002DBF3673|nr:glycoside hydrolase family 3 N-terminal domain-containing protein [Paenibacillus lautus]MEC0259606.1 glycoside hydrolase family 3 N-terminal domain-containing protein [Paenibacillus lautus]
MKKYRIQRTARAQKLVDSLDLRGLLNQVVCPAYARIQQEQREEEFGSVFFHPMEVAKLRTVIGRFKKTSAIPPLIVSDLECGPGNMIQGAARFPYMMGLSQSNSPELAYETGKIAAEEAGDIGYNWTFSPVADLAADPDSPVVSMRSPGKDPGHVIKMAGAYMRGLQDHGMMATIKHFPGDGHSSLDHHLTTPVNPLGMEEWWQGPGRVFQALIDEGAMAVMPGHISLPVFDAPDEYGIYPPATVSKRLLIDLLRKEMGFEGLVVSDAIEMGGAVGYMNYYDACAGALESGCDVLLFPRVNERFYAEMEKRLRSGRLRLESLRDRACRILSLKEQMGLFGEQAASGAAQDLSAPRIDKERGLRIADRVAREGITLVRDRKGLVPFTIKPSTRVLHAVIMNNHDRYEDLHERLLRELGKHTSNIVQWLDPGPDRLFEAASGGRFDLILCSIGSRLSYGLNVVRLHDEVARNMMGGWTKMETPIIFVSHYHPFVHKEYEASIDTIINTYGDIEGTAEHLVNAITGKDVIQRELVAHD